MTLTAIIETPELIVYGSPDTISLVTDIGPKGERGSLIFSNIGHPDSFTDNISGEYKMLSETLRGKDMYYRADTDSWYQWTGSIWISRSGLERLFKLKQNNVSFTGGSTTLTIPLSSLWNDTSISVSNINTYIQAVSSIPTFITVLTKQIIDTDLVLVLAGFTFELTTSSISSLTSTTDLDLIISLV